MLTQVDINEKFNSLNQEGAKSELLKAHSSAIRSALTEIAGSLLQLKLTTGEAHLNNTLFAAIVFGNASREILGGREQARLFKAVMETAKIIHQIDSWTENEESEKDKQQTDNRAERALNRLEHNLRRAGVPEETIATNHASFLEDIRLVIDAMQREEEVFTSRDKHSYLETSTTSNAAQLLFRSATYILGEASDFDTFRSAVDSANRIFRILTDLSQMRKDEERNEPNVAVLWEREPMIARLNEEISAFNAMLEGDLGNYQTVKFAAAAVQGFLKIVTLKWP
ncbi:MAG: hypothetical protein ABIE03_01535 [Patescibacteria group bacterium]|nr:hypothetical protein [Patescibacteria group bacterium]